MKDPFSIFKYAHEENGNLHIVKCSRQCVVVVKLLFSRALHDFVWGTTVALLFVLLLGTILPNLIKYLDQSAIGNDVIDWGKPLSSI